MSSFSAEVRCSQLKLGVRNSDDSNTSFPALRVAKKGINGRSNLRRGRCQRLKLLPACAHVAGASEKRRMPYLWTTASTSIQSTKGEITSACLMASTFDLRSWEG